MSHARNTDPDTSHEAAASTDITKQKFKVLGAYYRHRHLMIDHEACTLAGALPECTHQRCSDLRHEGWIAHVDNDGVTPFGKSAMRCVITDAGIAAWKAWQLFGDE